MTQATAAPPPPASSPSTYEHRHVHQVYDAIAPHFAATRYAPWPAVDQFLTSLPPYSLVADIGCGNGKYLRVAQESPNHLFALGIDRCHPLVHFAASSHTTHASDRRPADNLPVVALSRCDTAVADVLHMPLRDSLFDAALNIAVVHHLSTRSRRIAAWRESLRILRPHGVLLAYVWALERPETPQPKHGNRQRKMLSRRFDSQDVFVPWHMRRRKPGAPSDRILGEPQETHRRFYHVYREGELEGEVKDAGGFVERSYYDHQNWCAVVRKH